MSSIPVPDEQTRYSSRRQDDLDVLAWPVFSQRALELLRSAGEVLHPEPGELLWDAGDTYDLYLVLAGGVLFLDRRDVRLDAPGLFLMIGADPSTTWLHEVGVELDAKGFVVTRDGFVTSVPGVFAVGDVRAGSVKRVASAVGEGSVVISAVHSDLAGAKAS